MKLVQLYILLRIMQPFRRKHFYAKCERYSIKYLRISYNIIIICKAKTCTFYL